MVAYFNRVRIQYIVGVDVEHDQVYKHPTTKSRNRASLIVSDHLRIYPPGDHITEVRIVMFKEAPKELDVPHWAREPVQKMRRVYELPDYVSDRMIFAWLQESGQVHKDESQIRELIELAKQ